MDRFLDKKVAIIGMACRFPGGADNPAKFWELLTAGKNVVRDIPAERWQANRFFNDNGAASAKSYVRKGHFIDWDYKQFDAGFFNFAPREVEYFDPQQRLMLEVSWEAMENAGLDVAELAGGKTGVYVGGFTLDHMLNQMGSSARSEIGAHSAAGATLTMLSNRLSYAYDFRGPSISVDTACSSSLVAFSYAVNDLRSGAASMALVGGVNMMLRPEYPIAMSKGQFLARDGRSKSFDARADGYGRGEGAGLVVLKPLKAALEDGDRVLAVVEGAGVNQDGRTNGITVPNAVSQKALMETVVEDAAIDPRTVQYVEAHGTGTPVGDPLEASAISAVYGEDRDTACRLGSLKSNIGHLEAAAGIAAVIKSCLMLNANKVPAIAGLEQPNPDIPFGDNGLELAAELTDLAADGDTRRVAINSFGYGGTNAHAILARCQDLEWLDARRSEERHHATNLLPLSAQDGQALQQVAQACADHLRDEHTSLEDTLYTLSRRRTHLGHRLAVWGASREELADSLETFARDGVAERLFSGVQPFTGDKAPVFVFTGMGPQWWAMGQALYDTNTVYREAVDEADAIFFGIAGFSIRDEMLKAEAESRITETALAQPANFVIQYALTRALEAEGVKPGAVVGHSVGEITSAWAAGMLTLHDALLVACERSRIQAKAAGQGGMLAVGLSYDEAMDAIGDDADKVSVAAVNSPSSITLAGDEPCLERLREELEARDVFARPLTVEVPYHSPMMEPLKPELMEKLGALAPTAPATPLYSTVTGQRVEDERYDAAYWCRNVREPVFFAKTITSMLEDGYRVFVEVGPHPVLRSALKETFTANSADARSVQTLNRKQDELASFQGGVADVFAQGGELDWPARHPAGQLVSLPNYPWQRQELWREAEAQRRDRSVDVERPLLGVRDPGTTTWRADLADFRLGYLLEHVVDGMPIMPAAGYIETMLEAIASHNDRETMACRLSNIAIDKALILDSAEPRFTSVNLLADGSRVELHSVDERKPEK
ncbi:MAG: beta-ketoacyl synthase N-terminal-like domain-containing protein, partial [Pseudomonadota bacterium]